jgi:hypothetical protein
MTDLEIFNRLAEIEGAKETFHSISKPTSLTAVFENRTSFGYNPLTDDALNHQLMVKYKIDLDFTDDGYTRAWQYHHICGQDTLNKSTNRAICLAIIEAHK